VGLAIHVESCQLAMGWPFVFFGRNGLRNQPYHFARPPVLVFKDRFHLGWVGIA